MTDTTRAIICISGSQYIVHLVTYDPYGAIVDDNILGTFNFETFAVACRNFANSKL